MTQKDIFDIALKQSAADCSCSPEDFLRTEHVVTEARPNPSARQQHRGCLPEGPDPGRDRLRQQPERPLPLL